MKRKLINFTVAVASIAGFALAGPAAFALSNSNPHPNVTFCHATGSNTNPYVQITTNANGVISGHVNHQDTRDIIPEFTYVDHGVTKHFPGQNLTSEGLAILHNGCQVPHGGQGGDVDHHQCATHHEDEHTVNCHPTTGGMGGGNETTTPTGGQGGGVVLGASTDGQGAGVATVPSGGVNAGVGGVSTLSLTALTGLIASVASLGLGARRLGKSL